MGATRRERGWTERGALAPALALMLASALPAAVLAQARPKPGDVLSKRYRIDEALGEGGMAVVYAATELRSDERVAIKWMSTRRRDDAYRGLRLVREFDAVVGLDHPNVVRMRRIDRHRGRFYLVMELLEGESLVELLERGPVPRERALALVDGVLRGLGALHGRGVVHRDLKPGNILLAESERGGAPVPKLLDFGLSKKLNADDPPGAPPEAREATALTRDGAVLGTPLYMAPEQFRAAGEVDARADLYAVGVVLYEMLSGELPFRGESSEEIQTQVTSGTAVPLVERRAEVGEALSAAVMKAMAREPDGRFADAEDMRAALQATVAAEAQAAAEAQVAAEQAAVAPAQEASLWLSPGGWSLPLGALLGGGVLVALALARRRRGTLLPWE